MDTPKHVVLASDHAGFALKEAIKEHLIAQEIDVIDVKPLLEEADDYPQIMRDGCAAALEQGCPALVFGGSGNGEAMVANKVTGIRCALCYSEETAELARKHNDANVMSLGGRLIEVDVAKKLVDIFLTTDFEGGRHEARVAAIEASMSSQNILVTASILSADQDRLNEELADVEPFVDWVQIDVMDGKFVEREVYGPEVIASLQTPLKKDAHLMIESPADHIQEYLDAGADHITFHAEAVPDSEDRNALLQTIRAGGATAGIAINPETPLEEVTDVLAGVDMLLVMSVHPGAAGQSFIPDVLEKVKTARAKYPDLMIQMDGGVGGDTAAQCREAGATNLVSASYLFGADDRRAAAQILRGS